MIELELAPSDVEILASTLESALSDLRYEIANTDRLDYRNKLKEKKTVLEGVVRALSDRRAPA